MNKKAIIFPSLLLMTGLTLTGCYQTESVTETPISNETELLEDVKDTVEVLESDMNEISTVAQSFISGVIDTTTVDDKFNSAYLKAMTDLGYNEDINPDISSILSSLNAKLDLDNIETNAKEGIASIPMVLEEGGVIVEDIKATLQLNNASGSWRVSDVIVEEFNQAYGYIQLMEDLAASAATGVQ